MYTKISVCCCNTNTD